MAEGIHYGDTLAWNLYGMMKEREYCDLEINANGTKIYCHKVVVASASPVLRRIIKQSSDSKSMKEEILSLTMDFVPAEVAELLIKYFYTGEVPSEENEFSVEFYHAKNNLCLEEGTFKTMVEVEQNIQSSCAVVNAVENSTCTIEIINKNITDGIKESDSEHSVKNRKPSSRNKYHLPRQPPFTCPCENCGKIFESYERVRSHYRHHHSEKKFKCNQCPLRFLYPKDLTSHMRTHTGEKPFICDICGRGFAQMGSMYIHHKVHLKGKNYQGSAYPCSECIKKYVQKDHKRLASQLNLAHLREADSLICPNQNCARKFASIQTLRKHIYKDICNYSGCLCSACKIKFETHQQLKKHISEVHCTHRKHSKKMKEENSDDSPQIETNGSGDELQCDLCDSKFKDRNKFDDHMLLHENMTVCDTMNLENTDHSNLLDLCSEVVMDEDIE